MVAFAFCDDDEGKTDDGVAVILLAFCPIVLGEIKLLVEAYTGGNDNVVGGIVLRC